MKTSRLHNQSGQLIIESILLITAFFAVTLLVSREFRSREVIASIVSGPWVSLAGMIQNGSWAPPERAQTLHPSHHGHHISLKGDPVR